MGPTSRYITVLLLIAIFGVSVVVRLPHLRGPIRYRHELWLTAIVLRQLEIWEMEGLRRAHYAPIMTYPGRANSHINNQEALRLQMDPNGEFYYTSYPPFSLYFLHAFFGSLRIHPTEDWLRFLNIVWNLVCAVLVYLILYESLRNNESVARAAALFGFIVYAFSPETLWAQSTLYFCDIFAHMFFLLGIYIIVRLTTGHPIVGKWLLAFTAFVFVFAYTDWIGVMFSVGVFAFTWLDRKNERFRGLQLSLVAGVVGAIVLTVAQYSRIDGFSGFFDFAFHKYLYRSGFGRNVAFQIHVWSWIGWLRVIAHYVAGYFPALIVVCSCLLMGKSNAFGLLNRQVKSALLMCAGLPVVLHHIAFFNFTAIHDFSVLKGAPAIAIVAGLLCATVWTSGESTGVRPLRAMVVVMLIACCGLGLAGYERLLGAPDLGYKAIGDTIAGESHEDEIVFVEYTTNFVSTHPDAWEEPYPALALYAHRNIARWSNEAEAAKLAKLTGVSRGAVFTISDQGDRVTQVRHFTL